MKIKGFKNGMDIFLKIDNDLNQLINLKNLKEIKIWKNGKLSTILVFNDNHEMFINNNFQTTYDFIQSKEAISLNPQIYTIIQLIKKNKIDQALKKYRELPIETQFIYRAEYLYLKLTNDIQIHFDDFLLLCSSYLKKSSIQNYLEEFKIIMKEYLSENNDLVKKYKKIIEEFPYTSKKRELKAREYWSKHNGSFDATHDHEIIFKMNNNNNQNNFYKNYENQTRFVYDSQETGLFINKYYDIILEHTITRHYQEHQYYGIWTKIPEETIIKAENYTKGKRFYLNHIDIVIPRGWKCKRTIDAYYGIGPKPQFTYLERKSMFKIRKKSSLKEIKGLQVVEYEYTGRKHTIENELYFEINIITGNENAYTLNIFNDTINEICRTCENILRKNNNLPEIGKGWLSECLMYNLIKKKYPDALIHASPAWLKPQHLDVYVPSIRTAFEYQGVQHFMPINIFGGEKQYLEQKDRDNKKKMKCNNNGINLIYWNYDEDIDINNLNQKLSITE